LKLKIVVDNKPFEVEIKDSWEEAVVEGMAFPIKVSREEVEKGTVTVEVDGVKLEVELAGAAAGEQQVAYTARLAGQEYRVVIEGIEGIEITPEVRGRKGLPRARGPPLAPSARLAPSPPPSAPPAAEKVEVAEKAELGAGAVMPPMPGKVIEVRVKPGDCVKAGDVLLILEAMKMQNEIVAPIDGVVKEVNVAPEASVELTDVLVVIEPA
jgi:glutaconyl-CoA decarboxylase